MTTNDIEVVASVGARIDELGGIWMGGPVMAAGQALGFGGYPWPFYMIGRGGVLGDVDPSELARVMMFPSPSLVQAAWAEGRAQLEPDEGAARFIACAYDWATTSLTGEIGLASELLVALADEVDVSDAPLAAGWRATPQPVSEPERLVWAVQVLREQRGGIHAACVSDAGLAPVEAIMATEGEFMAAMYGWEGPYPDPEASKAAKAPVEEATNQRVAETYVLDEIELRALAEALETLSPKS